MATPPMEKSDEANEEQLEMAREQGEAYKQALNHMANEEADDGGMQKAGDYVVAYAVEKAEGMYRMENGELTWQAPDGTNCHIEVTVCDAADGRFIPMLSITATLLDENNVEVGTEIQPFVWHPWLYHYGRNWEVPSDGTYTLRVRIEAPDFPRHDKKNGERYAEPVEVEFPGVEIKTGQK